MPKRVDFAPDEAAVPGRRVPAPGLVLAVAGAVSEVVPVVLALGQLDPELFSLHHQAPVVDAWGVGGADGLCYVRFDGGALKRDRGTLLIVNEQYLSDYLRFYSKARQAQIDVIAAHRRQVCQMRLFE